MENKQQKSESAQPETRFTFDEYIQQLPNSKQSAHRWLSWLAVAALVIALGIFAYAIYTSITWKNAGETNVVMAWMYFFIAGAITAFLLGLDTLIVGATIPTPFEGSKHSYQTGSEALQSGTGLVLYGVVVTILAVVGIGAVNAGTLSLEDWVKYIVSFFVILGVGSGILAIIRRVLRPRNR